MVRVKFEDTSGGPLGCGGREEIRDMAVVPRVGETVCWGPDGAGFTVKTVLWVIGGSDYWVVVRGW